MDDKKAATINELLAEFNSLSMSEQRFALGYLNGGESHNRLAAAIAAARDFEAAVQEILAEARRTDAATDAAAEAARPGE